MANGPALADDTAMTKRLFTSLAALAVALAVPAVSLAASWSSGVGH